jgi:hypothetical protein
MMNMNKKAVAVIAGVGAIAGLAYLISRVAAKPATVQVSLASNPIRTALLIDDKQLVATPARVTLPKGRHTFKAVAKTPDTLLTYQIDKWLVNGIPVAYDTNTLTLNVTQPIRIRVDYMLASTATAPIMPLPQ